MNLLVIFLSSLTQSRGYLITLRLFDTKMDGIRFEGEGNVVALTCIFQECFGGVRPVYDYNQFV